MKHLPTSRKAPALLLLSFMANTQAADTYDAPSQILTIPQVVVGNTTFSNVVVKLKDIEVLKSDPNPLVGVVDQGFLMQFISAVQQGSQVKVTLQVTSQFKDRKADIGGDPYTGNNYNYARLTDDKGNVYTPKTTLVGNINSGTSTYVRDFPFSADIVTTIVLTYDNLATNATGIGSLDIVLYASDHTKPTYKVRNITFQKPSVVSPF